MMPFSCLVVLDVSPRVARMLFFSSFSQDNTKNGGCDLKVKSKAANQGEVFFLCVCVDMSAKTAEHHPVSFCVLFTNTVQRVERPTDEQFRFHVQGRPFLVKCVWGGSS